MSTFSDQRRLAEIAAGRKRLEDRYGFKEGVVPAIPEPKDPAESVSLSIPGVGDYQAGQAVEPTSGFVVTDADLEPEAVVEPEVLPPVVYTDAQLHEIAAKDGVKGLRAIATPLGVSGRGKDELIREIQKAQGTWVEPEVTEKVTEEQPVEEQPASPPLPPGMSADFDIDDLLK